MSPDEIRLEKLKVIYKACYKNYTILVTMGIIWLMAAYAGSFEVQLSILILFTGTTLFKPILLVTTKLLGAAKIQRDESLKLLTKLISLGVLFGFTFGFFAFERNINLFFPSFSIIFSVVFAAIFFLSSIKIYAILTILILSGGIYIGYYHTNEFCLAGYYTGSTMVTVGIVNGIIGKKSRIAFRLMKRRIKRRLMEPNTKMVEKI